MLYQISFIAALIFLSLWFYTQDRKSNTVVLRAMFLAAFGLFLTVSLWKDAEWSAKIFWLVRDMFFLGLAGTILSIFRKNALLFFTGLGLSVFLTLAFLKKEEHKVASNGELLLELQPTSNIENLQTAFPKLVFKEAFNPSEASSELEYWWIVDVPFLQAQNIEDVKEKLAGFEQVQSVEYNEIVKVEPLIKGNSTPIAQKRFSVNDPGLDRAWGFEAMEVEKLYTFLKNNELPPQKKARIAILDTGIDAKHEDLKANYVSTNSKYDKDTHGHGTHCAGIAASVTNNGLGIASFGLDNSFVQITSISVLFNGAGTQETIIDGMIKAADNGADVISMSLGGFSNDKRQKAYEQAVEYCNRKGTIIVVAAGNANSNAINYSPANVEGVIAVSAVDERLRKAEFSNYISSLKMGIAAPGVNIYSTTPKNTYDTFSGTSMATPYVAGLIGVLKSLNPDLTTQQAYNILNNTGKPTQNTIATGKLILPFQAIQAMD